MGGKAGGWTLVRTRKLNPLSAPGVPGSCGTHVENLAARALNQGDALSSSRKGNGLRFGSYCQAILAHRPPPMHPLTLGKSLSFSEPQFPHLLA